MENQNTGSVKRTTFWKKLLWILGILVLLLAAASFYFYNNFNRLLSDALMKSFNSGVISDVYELKFEKLDVNLLVGNIQVYNVELKPRLKPLADYPYINSSMELHAKKILLFNVELYTLLKTNILRLKRVELMEPEIEIKLTGKKIVLFPFRDTTGDAAKQNSEKKGFIEALLLKEFGLVNASLHMINEYRQRELFVKNLSISLKDLTLKQEPGRDLISNKQVDLSIGEIRWQLKEGGVQSIHVSEYKLKMDSLTITPYRR